MQVHDIFAITPTDQTDTLLQVEINNNLPFLDLLIREIIEGISPQTFVQKNRLVAEFLISVSSPH